jgi:hypothetical protein
VVEEDQEEGEGQVAEGCRRWHFESQAEEEEVVGPSATFSNQ